MSCALFLVPPPEAEARTEYVVPLFLRYPSASRLATCGTCHTDFVEDDTPNNPYGDAFEAAGGQNDQNAAFLAIETLDSDGDGTTNVAEITSGAGFMPGFDCTSYTSATNAPVDLADYVDPSNIGCSSVTTTTVSGGTTTTTTLPPGLCGATPLTTCRVAGKSAFQVKDKTGATKDQIKWSWKKGAAFTVEDLADPAGTTSYALCIYDRSAGVPSLVMGLPVPPSGLWKSKGSKGWSYADQAGTFAGVQKLALKSGSDGKTKAQVMAKGANLPMSLPFTAEQFFASDPGVTVQLINSNGTCWASEFTKASKNTPQLFKAK
jgi:hypothetical protein